MSEILLKDVTIEGEKHIVDWPFVSIDSMTKVYYKPDESDGMGFCFCAVSVTSFFSDKNIWDKESTCVDVLYWGYALFDGIRHLYLGQEQTDNFGYIYYPTLDDHIKILSELQNLVKKYCSQPD